LKEQGKGSNWPRQLDRIKRAGGPRQEPPAWPCPGPEPRAPPVGQARRERERGGEFGCECSCCVQCGCGSRGTSAVPPPKIISLLSLRRGEPWLPSQKFTWPHPFHSVLIPTALARLRLAPRSSGKSTCQRQIARCGTRGVLVRNFRGDQFDSVENSGESSHVPERDRPLFTVASKSEWSEAALESFIFMYTYF